MRKEVLSCRNRFLYEKRRQLQAKETKKPSIFWQCRRAGIARSRRPSRRCPARSPAAPAAANSPEPQRPCPHNHALPCRSHPLAPPHLAELGSPAPRVRDPMRAHRLPLALPRTATLASRVRSSALPCSPTRRANRRHAVAATSACSPLPSSYARCCVWLARFTKTLPLCRLVSISNLIWFS